MSKQGELVDAVESLLRDAVIPGISMREYHARMGKIKALAGQVFHEGRAAGKASGWDLHAQLVRERLTGLEQILLTAEEFKNLPVPELEPFDE